MDTGALVRQYLYYSWDIFWSVSIGVVALITIASLFRLHTLKRGGSAVAEMMDGKLLVDPGDDYNKQKLLNVVAEMAIASGTPVPPVYLIQDKAINAFAAGYSSSDAVIGMTTGAIENLNRGQLQGVVAHEFSHILNGDMRLNLRLIGVLHGILILAIAGRMILSSGGGRARKNQSGALVLGFGLMIIGYLGRFFGNLIKAAVSRQREFLADASAVQFTRNPDGIAGALKRIGGYKRGSVIAHPEGEALSHAFFSQGIKLFAVNLLATHPDLGDRIQRIEPGWNGKFLREIQPERTKDEGTQDAAMGFASGGFNIDPEAIINRTPQVVSRFRVQPRLDRSLPDSPPPCFLTPPLCGAFGVLCGYG
ncbi:MAG: M48 family metallopeptidase, partial [Lysobacterales bacterium]